VKAEAEAEAEGAEVPEEDPIGPVCVDGEDSGEVGVVMDADIIAELKDRDGAGSDPPPE
jgi:hypothetical protein